MNHLFRELAPVSAAAWLQIEQEASRSLKTALAARKLVDFAGPRGWDAAAVSLGRNERLPAPPGSDAETLVRRVLPLIELRVPFELRRTELDAAERGAEDIELDPVRQAARRIAIAENRSIFHGHTSAGIRGMCESGSAETLGLGGEVTRYPILIASALGRLRDRGIGGPYAVALSERAFTELTEATQHGYPVLQHVRRLIGDGPIVWSPGLDGALVVSLRGGDFQLTVGQDFSIGYLSHTADMVRLYLEESFTFWNITPEAAEPLAPEG